METIVYVDIMTNQIVGCVQVFTPPVSQECATCRCYVCPVKNALTVLRIHNVGTN